jgi:hypothetical protein
MEENKMRAYEVYEHNPATGIGTMIGILPERRKDLTRATPDSVLNWGRALLGDNDRTAKIYFVEIILYKTKAGTFWSHSAETSPAN